MRRREKLAESEGRSLPGQGQGRAARAKGKGKGKKSAEDGDGRQVRRYSREKERGHDRKKGGKEGGRGKAIQVMSLNEEGCEGRKTVLGHGVRQDGQEEGGGGGRKGTSDVGTSLFEENKLEKGVSQRNGTVYGGRKGALCTARSIAKGRLSLLAVLPGCLSFHVSRLLARPSAWARTSFLAVDSFIILVCRTPCLPL